MLFVVLTGTEATEEGDAEARKRRGDFRDRCRSKSAVAFETPTLGSGIAL
jgi:hypothetical protein